MKAWPRHVLWFVEASIVIAAVYLEPCFVVRGTLWREAWFDGKPTSYWRDELERWDTSSPSAAKLKCLGPVSYTRTSTWFERQSARLLKVNVNVARSRDGPRIIYGDEEALPVLHELAKDTSPKVRLFAEIGLWSYPIKLSDDDGIE